MVHVFWIFLFTFALDVNITSRTGNTCKPGFTTMLLSTQGISRRDLAAAMAIKQALLRRRLTVTALAGKLRKSRRATSVAIHHPSRYPKLRARIEEVLRA